jgi:hypothetical protein
VLAEAAVLIGRPKTKTRGHEGKYAEVVEKERDLKPTTYSPQRRRGGNGGRRVKHCWISLCLRVSVVEIRPETVSLGHYRETPEADAGE